MKSHIPYRENPEYYKRLIAEINSNANFPMHLIQEGYELVKKSAGSLEFHRNGDKIVLNSSREPMTYFNRNDSLDRGLFFKYIFKRETNFYKAIEKASKIARQVFDSATQLELSKTNKKPAKSLESNYNIVPLKNSRFLAQTRGISFSTINNEKFRGRIFNAYHIRDNGGKIPNIAFPKYDLNGVIKNYVLYNRPYKSRDDGQIRKFRLVLNKNDRYLFYSNPPSHSNITVIVGESALDAMAFNDLHGNRHNFYISFEGNIYDQKLEFFIALLQKVADGKQYSVQSIMDHDRKGFEFDLKILTALINASSPQVYLENHITKDVVRLKFNYSKKFRSAMQRDKVLLDKALAHPLLRTTDGFPMVKSIEFSNRLVLEFSLDKLIKGFDTGERQRGFELLVQRISSLYLYNPFLVVKSRYKDWNEELLHSNEPKLNVLPFKGKDMVSVGDTIELKLRKGPEGSKNRGRIIEKRERGVLCDFGLKYDYVIPYSGIKNVLKQNLGTVKESHKKSNKRIKNNNFQNNIL